jgi:hypothetical protein
MEVEALKDQGHRDSRHGRVRSITSCSAALIVPIFDVGAAFKLCSTPFLGLVSCQRFTSSIIRPVTQLPFVLNAYYILPTPHFATYLRH